MKTVNSISGGKTSAYIAANYPADYDLFALVRTDDKKCLFPDKKLRQMVEDRIQKPFIGTLEEDEIIHTIFNLEQYIGREVNWVSGITYDEVLRTKGGWLPNKLHRYCTTWLKLDPMFYWWAENIGEPVEMRIGFRANEQRRAKTMKEKLNADGLLEYKATFGKWVDGSHKGKNKWEQVAWQKPVFPLIENPTFKDQIEAYWDLRPVRFATFNNCVGCFHRNEILLKKMFKHHENKMEWFAEQERTRNDKGTWKTGITYDKIKQHKSQHEINFDDFSDCDSGYCGL